MCSFAGRGKISKNLKQITLRQIFTITTSLLGFHRNHRFQLSCLQEND